MESITIQMALRWAESQLREANVKSASLDARLLLQHVLQKDQTYIVIHHDEVIRNHDYSKFQTLTRRRQAHVPVAKIIGKKEFWSLPFFTSKHTLDPRPDSETLIEACLDYFLKKPPTHKDSPSHDLPSHAPASHDPPSRDYCEPGYILDIGTGTGCLLLTLLHEFREARGVGLDISKEALTVAKHNCQTLGLDNRCLFRESNWLAVLSETKELHKRFDLIVSNPPYIPPSDLETLEPDLAFDPKQALTFVNQDDPLTEDGLSAYRHLAKTIMPHLSDHGIVVVEYGENQHEKVREIFREQGFSCLNEYKDISGITRCTAFKGS